MTEPTATIDANFFQLVLSLQAGAMQQMGKVANPITGKVERDLRVAKATIDLVAMLEAKTKGNLNKEEARLLSHVLYELRLNYVDESKKPDQVKEAPEGQPAAENETEDSSSTGAGEDATDEPPADSSSADSDKTAPESSAEEPRQ